MRKVAISVAFAAMCVAISRFLVPLFLVEGVDGAIGLLLTTGLFTIAIVAVVRKCPDGRGRSVFLWRRANKLI
jgi:hypothetical protein